MKKVYFAILACFLSCSAFADSIRVYCKPDNFVILESRADDNFSEENISYDYPHFIIARDQIPNHQWLEQLRCNGNSLSADLSAKPASAQREEELSQVESELDSKLASDSSDLRDLLRLQRRAEKLKAQIHPNRFTGKEK